jgi:pantoate kinase
MRRQVFGAATAVALVLAGLAAPTLAQRAGGTVKAARADLADMASGTYFGDVISDARGASRSDVRLTVARTGPNQVRVTSDYPRLPAFTARLSREMDTLQNVGGEAVFLLDLSKSPRTLMVTVDDASWAGGKE